VTTTAAMFSTFADKTKYNGALSSHREVKFGDSLKRHYDKEVEKRGCDQLNIDASYKVPKHLFQTHGKAPFHALITGSNKYREIRLQVLTVTDGHDQLKPYLSYLCFEKRRSSCLLT
jgi:hypothetical protein